MHNRCEDYLFTINEASCVTNNEVEETSCELKCKECEADFENVKD